MLDIFDVRAVAVTGVASVVLGLTTLVSSINDATGQPRGLANTGSPVSPLVVGIIVAVVVLGAVFLVLGRRRSKGE
ncbi:hypothetical protein GCM10027418_28060 [Mariniluteicoccus endophyticus]